jgi:predicted Rossmann fold flavoprotein
MKKKLVVIGGGAAGFFCAVNAARINRDLDVIILEKTGKLLAKVKVSGGGRCNVTHAMFDIAEMSRRYPRGQHFVKKTFHQFFTTDTIKWFEQRGVQLKTENDGRMFPVTDSSQTIIDCLMNEARSYEVEIVLNAEVRSIDCVGGLFELDASFSGTQKMIKADFVCLATGGYPKASMFDWLLRTGHSIAPPLPSLFTFNLPHHPITQLMGVKVEKVRVRIEGSRLSEEGPLLVTHWGLSGPAILRLSAWGAQELSARNYTFPVHINWMPDYHDQSLKELIRQNRQLHPSKKISNQNFSRLPARLWTFLLEQSGIPEDLRFADLPTRTENQLVKNLVDYVAEVAGKTTFKEEFVTAGGIRLSEIDPNTMMSRKIPHLFFAGEVMDVDGITGGFNFQHAWTSGYIAATHIAGAIQND